MKLSQLKIYKVLLLFFALAGPNWGLFAQTNVPSLTDLKAKYPNEKVVQLKDIKTVTIKNVKGIPEITYHVEYEDIILDSKGLLGMNEEEINFSSLEEVVNITAYTLVPNGTKFRKVNSTDRYTRDAESEGSIFHDDERVTTVVYSNLVEGAIRHLSYDMKIKHNNFPFGYYFFSSYPCENAQYQIIADTSVHLNIKPYFLDKLPIVQDESVTKNMRTISFSSKEIFLVKQEDNAVSYSYYAPHILAQIAYYTTKSSGRVQVGETISDLHKQYYKNIKDVIDEAPTEEMQETVDSIIVNCKTDFEKVKAIYYWVQNNLKYVAFEEGLSGFIPRQPSRILEKRFGDCKDMASLIYAMLKAAGVESHLTWIGSRDLPYKYSDFPSTYCDNHMICSYKDESGKWWFLDATNSFQPISGPTYFIQGKEALIHMDETNFELATVPIMPKEYTSVLDSSFVRIDGRNIIGKTTNHLTGYYQSFLGNVYRDVPIKELNNFLKSMNERGNNSFRVTGGSYTNGKERDSVGIFTFDWDVMNYCTQVDNEIYVNLILDKDINSQGEIKKDRVSPVELPSMSSDNYVTILEIPEGYQLKHKPDDVNYNSDVVDLSVKYEQRANKIYMTLHLNLKYLYLYPEQFESWNKFILFKKKTINESIILIKK